MKPLLIRLRDEVTLAVPPRLDSITTYVLLEQETWFEKELGFLRHWLKPGMNAIDVGANLGVYALPMARLVGPSGRVAAYEPGREANALLRESSAINSAANLAVSDLALSDGEREGRLITGASSELNALGTGGEGESVRVTSLDRENEIHEWRKIDFVKIDAEGEEERILAGGRKFFAQHSPLVMFEIKAGAKLNEGLAAAFRAAGYESFRLLVGAPILVPVDAPALADPFELNLFAAKPDRISLLRESGFLADAWHDWKTDAAAAREGLAQLRALPLSRLFAKSLEDPGTIAPDYLAALAAYACWRDARQPVQTRCAALAFGYRALAALCNRAPTIARLSTFSRIAFDFGWRNESLAALQQAAKQMQRNDQPGEPFWPANPRFDAIWPDEPATWIATSIVEQIERLHSHSTYFSGMSPWLEWVCAQPHASTEMRRRRTLLAARAGSRPRVPDGLRTATADHLNADLWAQGLVPGTAIAP